MNIKFRPVLSQDFDFAFEAKKQAMGEHILARWEWNEEFQLNLHRTRWNEKPWFVIDIDGTAVGTISLHEIDSDTLRLGEFYLLDVFRNNGLGTAVLVRVLEASDTKDQTVVLEALKWNPVRSLYERHGFNITSENEIHYFMERKPMETQIQESNSLRSRETINNSPTSLTCRFRAHDDGKHRLIGRLST